MRKLGLLILVFLMFGSATVVRAQDDMSWSKAELKQKKRAERDSLLAANRVAIKHLLDSQQFVVEADFIYNRFSSRIPVVPETNFVLVDGNDIVIQFGFIGGIGANGLGGRTIRGKIQAYEARVGEAGKRPMTVTIHTTSFILGQTTLFMTFNNDGSARVRVRGSFARELSYVGYINTLENTSVFEGIPNYPNF